MFKYSPFFFALAALGLSAWSAVEAEEAEKLPDGLYDAPAAYYAAADGMGLVNRNLPFYCAYPLNVADNLRASMQDDRFRLVIETKYAPNYQISLGNSGQSVIIELLDVHNRSLKLPAFPKAADLKGWSLKQKGLDTYAFTVDLNHPVDRDSVKAFTLNNPHRLVIDINTAYNADEKYQISPGVTWVRQSIKDGAFGTLIWNQLCFDRSDPNVTIDVALARSDPNKLAKLSSIVAESKALAGVNGGFFNMPSGGILGVTVKDGKVIAPHVGRRPARSVFAVTQSNDLFIERIKVLNGKPVKLNGNACPPLRLALGAGPTLLKNGQINITVKEEQLGPGGNDITRACGRTAVAYNKNTVMLATLSGPRDSHSQGWKLPTMAGYLLKKGMTEALNLDGGGSVDMSIADRIVANGPQAGSYERPIATALVLRDSRGPSYPGSIKLTLPKSLSGDSSLTQKAVLQAFTPDGKPAADGSRIKLQGQGVNCPGSVVIKNGRAEFPISAMRGVGAGSLTAYNPFAKTSAGVKLENGRAVGWQARLNSLRTEYEAAKPGDLAEEQSSDKTELLDRLIKSKAKKNKSASLISAFYKSAPAAANSFLTESGFDGGVLPSPVSLPGITAPESEEMRPELTEENGPSLQAGGLKTTLRPPSLKPVRKINLDVVLKDEWKNNIPSRTVQVYDSLGSLIGEGKTDADGVLNLNLTVPGSCTELHFKSEEAPELLLDLTEAPQFKSGSGAYAQADFIN
ncbi:phosphodiester glycosidase family protein [bacterium]|nr:phosphodiester glycosidase family protein [bacterium]